MFLKLKNGVPSHDTFSRLFRLLDPAQFGGVFQWFMARFSQSIEGVVAIDGKVLRRSFDRASGKSPLHMVSAWGCEQRLVLAQIATDGQPPKVVVYRPLAQPKGRGDHPARQAVLELQTQQFAYVAHRQSFAGHQASS